MYTGDRKSRNNPQICFETSFYLHLQQIFCKKLLWGSKIDLAMPSYFFLFLLLCMFILSFPGTNTKEIGKKKFKRKGVCYKEMTNKK